MRSSESEHPFASIPALAALMAVFITLTPGGLASCPVSSQPIPSQQTETSRQAEASYLSEPVSMGSDSTTASNVMWRAEARPQTVRPGETVTLRLEAEIRGDWHMYALDSPVGQALNVTVDSLPDGVAADPSLRQSPPDKEFDPNFQDEAYFFDESAEVRTAIRVSDGVEQGSHTLGGDIRYMVCNDDLCMPPRTTSFTVRVSIEAGEPRPAFVDADYEGLVRPEVAPSSSTEDVRSSDVASAGNSEGLWVFLLLAAGAGLGAFLMPCILPMVPLTVSHFANASSRGKSFRHASIYGITIIVTFTGLGALAAAVLGAAGAQAVAANPWVNLGIGAVLVVFALSLLGLFEVRMPQTVANVLNRQSDRRGGYTGSIFMGLTLTVVSFSCTAPFVGGLLAAASQGTWVYPVLGMLVFSSVLALPFVAFALFPDALERLPSSGPWMRVMKVTLGFVELAAALKFFSNADLVWNEGAAWLPRPLVIALTISLLLMAGAYLLGKLRITNEADAAGNAAAVGVGRSLAGALFLALGLYMAPGLWGAPLGGLDAYLPPSQADDPGRLVASSPGEDTRLSELNWHTDDIDAAMAKAEVSGKPVFVDFTGYTCTNCREMEANVFPKPIVSEHLRSDFVRLRLYTDSRKEGPALRRYQQDLIGTVALPSYAIITPAGEVKAQHSGMAAPDAFDRFLERGLSTARRVSQVAPERSQKREPLSSSNS
ncbi:protein-disulfide reductase DsbD family protein [Longibacter salinarum]|uniref:protein-disulfide reductase DsbD family protein n=1 Tax=Longibacter salinarum TaxID=1850348 RepID=UPI0015CF35CD|nr:cytochrome c biogenesis protein CcdA [Longibacter salinarum]